MTTSPPQEGVRQLPPARVTRLHVLNNITVDSRNSNLYNISTFLIGTYLKYKKKFLKIP